MRKDRRGEDETQQDFVDYGYYGYEDGVDFSLDKRVQSQVYESATEA